ncbi:MAG: hypothetical protein Q7S34_02115 [bacterium]|nr:hypothetical protein [bacterium]
MSNPDKTNQKNIYNFPSPATVIAVRVAHEAITTYQEMLDESLSSIEGIVSSVRNLLGKLAEGASAEETQKMIDVFIDHCIANAERPPSKIQNLESDPGLKQKQKWLHDAGELKFVLSQERVRIEKELARLTGAKKLGETGLAEKENTLKHRLAIISSVYASVGEIVAPLEAYMRKVRLFEDAVRLVQKGPAKEPELIMLDIDGLYEELAKKLESAEAPTAIAPVQTVRVVCEPVYVSECVSLTPSQMNENLQRISCSFDIPPGEVFQISLYEILPRKRRAKNNVLQANNRGFIKLIEIATQLGMGKAFGWETVSDVIQASRGTRRNNLAVSLLAERGTPLGGSMTFVRTDIPLPWSVTEIFTQAHINLFPVEVVNETIRRKSGK